MQCDHDNFRAPASALTSWLVRAGLRPMGLNWKEFERIVGDVLARYFAQNARPIPPAQELAAFIARLAHLIGERGLPRPLSKDQRGTPGGMAEEECASLVARVFPGTDPLLMDAARQLVKACFYPEFKDCRDSFRETGRDGSCRRQELARVKGRVSGSHCVDCPHWVALRTEEHEAFLAREWRAGANEFLAHRTVFLPEDFRALRLWLHRAARAMAAGED